VVMKLLLRTTEIACKLAVINIVTYDECQSAQMPLIKANAPICRTLLCVLKFNAAHGLSQV
jgi:hypothetical protein